MIVNITERQKQLIEYNGLKVVEIKRVLKAVYKLNPTDADVYFICRGLLIQQSFAQFAHGFDDGIESLRELGKSLSETIINIAENMNRFENKYKAIRKIGDVRHLPFVEKRIYHRCRNTC